MISNRGALAVSIGALTNPAAKLVIEKLKEPRDCEVHMIHIPTLEKEAGLRRHEVNLTSDPGFSAKNIFIC